MADWIVTISARLEDAIRVEADSAEEARAIVTALNATQIDLERDHDLWLAMGETWAIDDVEPALPYST